MTDDTVLAPVPEQVARFNYYYEYCQTLEALQMIQKDLSKDFERRQDLEVMVEGYRSQLRALKDAALARDRYIEQLEKRMDTRAQESRIVADQRSEAYDIVRELLPYVEPMEMSTAINPNLERLLVRARRFL